MTNSSSRVRSNHYGIQLHENNININNINAYDTYDIYDKPAYAQVCNNYSCRQLQDNSIAKQSDMVVRKASRNASNPQLVTNSSSC